MTGSKNVSGRMEQSLDPGILLRVSSLHLVGVTLSRLMYGVISRNLRGFIRICSGLL